MFTLLLKNAYLITMDNHQREIPEGGLFVRDGIINTHHHFYQTLTRAVPAAQDANLFNWLKTRYPIWARLLDAEQQVQLSFHFLLRRLWQRPKFTDDNTCRNGHHSMKLQGG